jgi:hypothetical protein
MLASKTFQDAIEPPSAFDIVVLILWSRLGTPLPERTAQREYHGIDGRAPVTGTEWEYEEALKAARNKPNDERHCVGHDTCASGTQRPVSSQDMSRELSRPVC